MEKVWVLKLENGASLEVRGAEELGIKRGDLCVFRRDFYEDMGVAGAQLPSPSMTSRIEDLPQVQRVAGEPERAEAADNTAKARADMAVVREWIEKLSLEMNPVNAHYTLDRKLLTVQFCADGRVDFRELVKELSHALSVRIELRQIGVRDETGIYGGIAVCGQVLCCSRFLKEFNSINVKMAKEQDLLLTPGTISGVCGRLKCCLKYEHDGYLELEKGMPRKGEFCETPAGKGRITDRNLLTSKVSVTFENGNVSVFHVSEITVCPPERHNSNSSDRNKNRPQEKNAPRNNNKNNPGAKK
ncbi:MAG: stage 0 sporulation protein [Lentisphaeria bacterium]|nr:stage 0 sporulation protein [Lentisphaeria bacterium]MBR2721138.1 stage 0 sporulation protein [Lentisphaeria bacterium]